MPKPIDLALRHIFTEIPREVLAIAFPSDSSRMDMTTLENRIVDEVIRGRVLEDCNITNGRMKEFELNPDWIENTIPKDDDWTTGTDSYSTYRIPPEVREGVDISEVIRVEPPRLSAGAYSPIGPVVAGSILDTAATMLNSYTDNSHIRVPIAEKVSGDIIRIFPAQMISYAWIITVRLVYDGDLTGLNSSAYIPFAQLAVTATKMVIFNKLRVRVDAGFISGGMDIQAIRTIIDEYRDQAEEYIHRLSLFTAGATLDPKRFRLLIRSQL